jgi:nucleotide-binding universal stress UspA family protein
MAAKKKLTDEVIAAFLARLRECGMVEKAANTVGLTKGTIYAHAARHGEFKAAMVAAQREGRARPKTAAEAQREAYMAILANPEASERAKLDAGDQLRKLDAEERRQRRELGGGEDPVSDAPAEPEISDETAATLRRASVNAWVSILTATSWTPRTIGAHEQWSEFAAADRDEQAAVLEAARAAGSPAAVLTGIEMVLAGKPVGEVLDMLAGRNSWDMQAGVSSTTG